MEIVSTIINFLTAILSILSLVSPNERKRRNNLMRFSGQYQGYHLATTRSGNVITSSLSIKKCFGKRLKIGVTSFGYRYRGKIQVSDTNVYLFLEGIGHREQILMIFNEPLAEGFDILQGAFIAVTETRIPACGKIWLQKVNGTPQCNRIPQEQVDSKVIAFLSSPDNPITIDKLDSPIYEDIEFNRDGPALYKT